MKFHLLRIALRPNSRPSLINLIKFLDKQKKNWWISWNKGIKNRNMLKNNWLLSTHKHWLSESTEVINEISFKLPSQLLVHKKHVSKIPASFDDNFYQLSMNNRIKAAKFEPEPTFENTINDIKDNHLKFITSIAMNISAINSNKPSSSFEHLKSDLVPFIILQSPG